MPYNMSMKKNTHDALATAVYHRRSDSLADDHQPAIDKAQADMIHTINNTLDSHKAEAIATINLRGKSDLADVMIIASGTSSRHVAALADYVKQAVKENYDRPVAIEGLSQADWVLLDLGDIIIHLFRPEVRQIYQLEQMWSIELLSDSEPA